MALLVHFDPEQYTEHMRKWAHWLQNYRDPTSQDGGDLLIGKSGGSSQKLGFYKGGKENILRKHPYTAKGKQSDARSPSHFCPEGYDTEYAIDLAVKELGRFKVNLALAVEEQFMRQGTRLQKAARLGVSVDTFKFRTAEAQTFIVGYMRGTKYREKKAG